MTASIVEICQCLLHLCIALMPFAWFAGENKPSPVLFHNLDFFFLFLIGCSIFLSEMNASFSLHQSRTPLVEPGAVLVSLIELDLAGMLYAIKELSLSFELISFFSN